MPRIWRKVPKKIDDFFTVTQNNVVTEDSIDSSNNNQIIFDDDSNIEIKEYLIFMVNDPNVEYGAESVK